MASDSFPLSNEDLKSLRRVAAELKKRRRGVPFRDLLELARSVRGDIGVTVDVEASLELEQPLIVVQVPRAATPLPPAFARLTPREREVATLVASGLANKEIAARLGISLGTTKDHVHRVLEKTGLSSRAAVAAALGGFKDTAAK